VQGIVGTWEHLLTDTSRTFALYEKLCVWTAVVWAAVPAALLGAALRAARASEQARAGGFALCAGVFFACLGYAVSDIAVSALGAEALLRLIPLGLGLLAAVAAFAGGERVTAVRSAVAVALLVAVAGLLVGAQPGKGASVLSNGVFARFVHRDSGFAHGKPVFAHNSRTQSVAAYADSDYRFVFTLDGAPLLFGNRFHTARTLTGYVPLVLRPGCRRAAVVGREAGLYLPFFARAGDKDLAYGGTDSDAVKLAVAADAYLTEDDACEKAALRRCGPPSKRDAYDVIFLAPGPGWMRGEGTSYGRRWFERCRRALSEDGVVALHVDARALSAERFAGIASAFAAVFPGVQLWCTGPSDWVLVGGAREIKAPVDKMLGLFERTGVFRDFVRAGGLALPEVLACMVCDGKGLAPWLARTKKASAWRAAWGDPQALFEQGNGTLRPETLEGCRQWKSQWILPGETDLDMYLALVDKVGKMAGARVEAVSALSAAAKGKSEAALNSLRDAAAISPHDALLINRSETLELEGRRRLAIGDLKGALKCFETLLSFAPEAAFPHYGMGLCLRNDNDNNGAYLHFSRAVVYAPEQVDYRLEMAQSALTVGQYAEADRQYREALKRAPDNPAVLLLSAKALVSQSRPQKDTAQAVRLAERACVVTQWKNREYIYGLADIYIEAGKVLEGMGLKRRLKEGGFAPKTSVKP
jgi:tetratricopeptide (TPR) repeat protein